MFGSYQSHSTAYDNLLQYTNDITTSFQSVLTLVKSIVGILESKNNDNNGEAEVEAAANDDDKNVNEEAADNPKANLPFFCSVARGYLNIMQYIIEASNQIVNSLNQSK